MRSLALVLRLFMGVLWFVRCSAQTHKFHSSGREDVDVRMLGDGRSGSVLHVHKWFLVLVP